MKEITIAEILHHAADKYLASTKNEYWYYDGAKEKFSCSAMHAAVINLLNADEIEAAVERIRKGLELMGCPIESLDAFNDRNVFSAENQQARYAWLKFAATMAEEQGV